MLLVGVMGIQVVVGSGDDEARVGVVGEAGALESALRSQAELMGVEVTVVPLDDAAARAAVEEEDVDAALIDPTAARPELLLPGSSGQLEALVGGAVANAAIGEQLAEAGVQLQVPEVAVTTLQQDQAEAEAQAQAAVVALVGVALLYGLLILFAQFVAKGWSRRRAAAWSSCCSPP